MARTLKCDSIQDPDGSSPNISLTDAVTAFGSIPVDIDSGNIDGCTVNSSDITISNGNTLNTTAGTLTTSSDQKDAIVDGSTAISRSSNDLTFAGTIQVNGNVIKSADGGTTIQMNNSGDVSVETGLTCGGDLTVNGNDISTASTMNFKPGGTSKMELQTDGDLVVTGDVTAFGTLSDENMKKNINTLEGDAMAKINDLRVVKYEFKPEFQDHEVRKGTQIGLIAQEVQGVFPECVKEKDDGTLTIQYEQLCALLIKGLQEIYTHGVPQETSFDWVRNGTVVVKD